MLILAGLLRLLAAVFSQGFLASDDHHVVINAADQIARGAALPSTYARSVLFPASLGGVMAASRSLGITDPGVEMLIIRLLQGAYSLLVVYFVYRILERSSGRNAAELGGLLAAAFFAMPVTAVHQLEESVCQVPLLAACWWWQRAEGSDKRPAGWGALAGAALGTALILRLPLLAFAGVFVVLILLRSAGLSVKLTFLGGLAAVIVLQGYSNAIVNHEWGYSFIHRMGAVLEPQRLMTESEGYPRGAPWLYVLTLLAALIPPASIALLAASVDGGRRLPLFGLTALAFLVSHSLIANKQERFLLPILPVLFILIAAGLPWLAARLKSERVYRGMWWYFWAVNGVLLVLLTFSFSKKDRVAPLLYVFRRHDATGVLVGQYNETFHVPEYYLGRPRPLLAVLERRDTAVFTAQWVRDTGSVINYVILYSDDPDADSKLLGERLHRTLTLLTVITPSLADRIAHAINPRHNKARTAAVYTTL
ncbi:MAG TPA: glycosyltransferase family 39 protein [Gemmatimonadales bacterium]|nr:glycosyltransferase family 39 protein [Gemmatimonadales bacterium]